MDVSYFESLSFTFKTQHLPLHDVLIWFGFFFFSEVPCFLSFILTRTDILILHVLLVEESMMMIIIS